ncbi:hypothetical protein AK830_g11810 [Neonectria ditissima]|uniref:Cyanovirin-N domain-containing protein n=1 Tax=Neonectria ditissima TaxID=78410 RepID=A0A0N8H4Z7_9HYPO|nr:hypothetical protein AK830_g11810 [Neonectria ditissima]
MFISNVLQAALFAPTALALAIHLSLDEATGKLVPRVDQPDGPWINEACFNPLTVNEGEKFYDCPKKIEQKESHWCPVETDNECESYCEQSLQWSYGREVPFDNSRCGEGSHCRLDEGMSVQVGQTTTFGLQIGHGAFTLGASFSWSESKTTSNSIVREKPADRLDDCGYWTFVPYMVTSCGITSKAAVHENILNSRWCADRVDKEECLTSVYQTKAGVAGGAAVFVATSCDDGDKRLGFCKQDAIYLKQGVSVDERVHLDWRDAWKDWDSANGVTTTAEYQCQQDNWPPA